MKQYISNLKNSTSKSKFILGFVVLAAGGAMAYSYLNTPEVQVTPSVIGNAAMNETTVHGGSQPLDQEYVKALSEADKQRAEAAEQTGTSAIPTIVGNLAEPVSPIEIEVPKLEETPDIQEPNIAIEQKPILMTPVTESVPIVAPPPVVAAADPERIERMMQNLTRRPNPVAEVVQFNPVIAQPTAAEQTGPEISGTDMAAAESKIKLPLAGTILYAQLVGRANSDYPGPVLAKILQGEYTGATLIGSFQNAQNALTISFDRMTVATTRSGEEINETVPIQAVAVDTRYIGTGLATSVDRHLFQKLAIGFVAGFAQGFGDAISQTGETTIDTGNGTITTGSRDLNADEELLAAGGQAVSEAGNILQQEFGNRPTTVIVEAGTPLGVLFLQ